MTEHVSNSRHHWHQCSRDACVQATGIRPVCCRCVLRPVPRYMQNARSNRL